MQKFRLVIVSVVTTAILISCLIAVYFLYSRQSNTAIAVVETTNVNRVSSSPAPQVGGTAENPFLPPTGSTSSVESPVIHALEILWRLFLAVVLAAILAFRPRKNAPLFGRNLYVAQTQILLAVVVF